MSRIPVLAANWKMNHLRADASRYAGVLGSSLATEPVSSQIVLFPPATLLHHLSQTFAGSDPDHKTFEAVAVETGGQDVHPEASGAHTGDLSAAMLLDAGAQWALCGHSERRRDHLEGDSWISKKVSAAKKAGLSVMFCIGETQDERESGATQAVLGRQLEAGLPSDLEGVVVAYEPVWAIGTGLSATPEMAQEVHSFLRNRVAELRGKGPAQGLRVLYGGSVKPKNCEDLLEQADIDGFLIGGAGLDPKQFLDIIRRCDAQRRA